MYKHGSGILAGVYEYLSDGVIPYYDKYFYGVYILERASTV